MNTLRLYSETAMKQKPAKPSVEKRITAETWFRYVNIRGKMKKLPIIICMLVKKIISKQPLRCHFIIIQVNNCFQFSVLFENNYRLQADQRATLYRISFCTIFHYRCYRYLLKSHQQIKYLYVPLKISISVTHAHTYIKLELWLRYNDAQSKFSILLVNDNKIYVVI